MNRPYVICHMVVSLDGKPLLGDSPISQYAFKGVKQYGDGILFLNYKRRSEEIK